MRKGEVFIGEERVSLKLYHPGDKRAVAIVLCHDLCGIQAWLLPEVASYFAGAGFAVATFDYRGFGDSGGERARFSFRRQSEDLCAVIDWLQVQDDIDSDHIGLWGTGLGCHNTLVAAARCPGVTTLVCQLPWGDGGEWFAESDKAWQALLHLLPVWERERKATGSELWLPLSQLFKQREARRFYQTCRRHYPNFPPKVPISIIDDVAGFDVVAMGAQVKQPVLVVLPGEQTPRAAADGQAFYDALGGEKVLNVREGASYYTLYEHPEKGQMLWRQLAWFRHHLQAASRHDASFSTANILS